MAYTNIWNQNRLTGAEAANTIATLINAVRTDVQDRFQDIFATPDFTVDPLRPYGIKFTDVQDSVINFGDNGGIPRNLIIKNKAASSTYYTFSSTGLTIQPTTAIGFQISTLINNTAGLQLHQAGVQDWSIGNIASSGNFVINNGSGFAGTNCLTLTSGGAFQFIGSLQLTSNIAAPVGGFGKSASQGLVISGVTGSTNDFLLTNGLGQNVLSVSTGTQNAVFANSLIVANGLTINAAGVNITGGVLINTGGLTVTAGTTTVQGLSAGSLTVSGSSTFTGGFSSNTLSTIVYANPELRISGNAINQNVNLTYYDNGVTEKGHVIYAGANSVSNRYFGIFSDNADYFICGSLNNVQTQLCVAGVAILTVGTNQVVTISGTNIIGSDSGAQTGELLRIGGSNAAGFVGLSTYNSSTAANSFSGMRMYHLNGSSIVYQSGAVATEMINGGNGNESVNLSFYSKVAGVNARRGYFDINGVFTLANSLTVTAGGLTVSAGTTAVQALTATTLNTSGLATVNSLLSVGAITTNQNDLTLIGGAVDTLFRNSANNATNVSISDAGDLVALRGIINTVTGYRVGNSAASGNFLRGNGTNFVPATISTSDLPTLDTVRAYKSASTQVLSQNTLTAISFDAEDYDTNTMHDNVTNNSRLTAQTSGKYKITAHIGWTGVTSNVFIIIRKNGVATNLAETFLTVTNTSVGTTEVNCTLSLAAADYVEVYGQGDNVTPTILNNQERTYFEMQKLTA